MNIRRKVQVLLVALEEQGCTIQETRRQGYRILCPDGVTTIGFHSTPSDPRAIKNIQAEVKRAGLIWPKGLTLT